MAFYDDFHPVFCIFLLYFNDFTIFAKYDNPLSYLFTIRWTMFFFTVPAAEYFPRKPTPDLPSPRASSSTSTFLWTFVRQRYLFYIYAPAWTNIPLSQRKSPCSSRNKGLFLLRIHSKGPGSLRSLPLHQPHGQYGPFGNHLAGNGIMH